MATSYKAAEVVELLDDSDFGFSESESDESGDEKDGRMYSYCGKSKLTSIELTSLVASMDDTPSVLFRTSGELGSRNEEEDIFDGVESIQMKGIGQYLCT